jgi:hypothetical protein
VEAADENDSDDVVALAAAELTGRCLAVYGCSKARTKKIGGQQEAIKLRVSASFDAALDGRLAFQYPPPPPSPE